MRIVVVCRVFYVVEGNVQGAHFSGKLEKSNGAKYIYRHKKFHYKDEITYSDLSPNFDLNFDFTELDDW